jgi:flagellar basal-body rod protein FlgB
MNVLDKVFGVSPDVLTVRSRRSELIAANLANADTPHYKAMDLDFGAALSQATNERAPGRLQHTSQLHLNGLGAAGLGADTRYRIPSQPSLDGNTVETDREHMAFMDNAIRYQASLNFLDGRIKGLILAIRGE